MQVTVSEQFATIFVPDNSWTRLSFGNAKEYYLVSEDIFIVKMRSLGYLCTLWKINILIIAITARSPFCPHTTPLSCCCPSPRCREWGPGCTWCTVPRRRRRGACVRCGAHLLDTRNLLQSMCTEITSHEEIHFWTSNSVTLPRSVSSRTRAGVSPCLKSGAVMIQDSGSQLRI